MIYIRTEFWYNEIPARIRSRYTTKIEDIAYFLRSNKSLAKSRNSIKVQNSILAHNGHCYCITFNNPQSSLLFRLTYGEYVLW